MHQTVPRRTILCVGSDASARELIAETLPEYDLVFAGNAFEAIRAMNARPYDGYITDFWLPDWCGLQLCRGIRTSDPHCPVIFFTVAAGETRVQRATRAGASAFISIPETHTLKRLVTRLLSLADAKSLAAKRAMEDAAMAELERCAAGTGDGARPGESFIERKARTRAQESFIDAGGSRAHFDRWWPQVFASTRANRDAACA